MPKRAIVRTEAIVLRSLNYGETSQIVTLFTREKGKLAVIAKGARQTQSRFGSSLQPMAYTQVVFYYKPTRTLHTLSESAHAESFHRIQQDLKKITVGLRVVEALYGLLEDQDPQPSVFNVALHVLRRLNASQARIENLWPYFQLRLATALGLAPAVNRTTVTQITASEGLLSLEDGNVYPLEASPRTARRASRAALRAFAVFARADLDAVMRMSLTLPVRREVSTLIDDYMRYHFEEAYPSRSRRVIGQLLSGTMPDEPTS